MLGTFCLISLFGLLLYLQVFFFPSKCLTVLCQADGVVLNHQLLWMHLIFNLLFFLFRIFFPLLVPHEHINFYIHFHSWLFCLPFLALQLVIIRKQLLHHVIPVSCLTILCHQWFYIFIVCHFSSLVLFDYFRISPTTYF